MLYYVYMLKTIDGFREKSYVGYTNNLQERIKKHNSNKGAKSTRGYKWKLIFKKKFLSRSEAMIFEYKLKKDRNKRQQLKLKSEKKN